MTKRLLFIKVGTRTSWFWGNRKDNTELSNIEIDVPP